MSDFIRKIRLLTCDRCQTDFELLDAASPNDHAFARLEEWLSEHDKHIDRLRVRVRELHSDRSSASHPQQS
jgi:hypothetical protein